MYHTLGLLINSSHILWFSSFIWNYYHISFTKLKPKTLNTVKPVENSTFL